MIKFFARLFSVIFLFIFSSLPVNGGIVFSDLDLSADNQLLFRADSGSGGVSVQDALFVTRLAGTLSTGFPVTGFPVQQLTVFPEKIDLLGTPTGRVLQIRNAFGAMRVPVSGGLPMPIPGLPSFAAGSAGASDRAEEMAPSSDGRWLLYLDPISPAMGNLVMVDVHSGAKIQVASRLERPEKIFPASWSPDSRLFVYERDGKLYYYMAGTSVMPQDEKIRCIGEGKLSSVFWGRGGDFYYLKGTILYRVRSAELFTRALYVDFLEIGAVVGKIPFEFDPGFDSFWIAPDARSLLVSKGHRSLFYYPLGADDADEFFEPVLPYLMLPRSCSEINVIWSNEGTVTVLVSIPEQTGIGVRTWRLDISKGRAAAFDSLPPPGRGTGTGSFPSGSLSPDGRLAVFWGEGGILLYDYVNWKLIDVLGVQPGISCLWAENDELIVGDNQKIERIRLTVTPENATPPKTFQASVVKREMICLSRALQAGFEERTFRILARGGDAWFVTDGRNPWTAISNPRLRSASQSSAQYRVYVERQGSGYYLNLPMIRNITSVGTFSLFPPALNPDTLYPASGYAAEPPYVPGAVFTRGIRTGLREAALCFDLYDDDQGLPETLDALNRFGIRATFFLNGEFIRRHPLAVQDIAVAGHEIASMFFAPLDFSDARYQGGADFISRGLARNEDEFYKVTGKELALLWHPPWYTVSPDIAAAAARAGYISTGRDVDPLDWVSREDEKKLGLPQRSPSEMIDSIMEAVKPGSIIPVRLGLLSGGRNDYLFNRINVLIDALIREGYTLTTVSTLIEHAM